MLLILQMWYQMNEYLDQLNGDDNGDDDYDDGGHVYVIKMVM